AFALRTTDGGTWSDVPVPKPAMSELTNVSCITAVRCRAVGYAGDRTLVARTTNGIRLSRQASPNLGAGRNVLRSADCTNSTHGTAAGSYTSTGSAPHERTLVLHTTNGRDWTVMPSPNPAPNQSDSPLRDVSCTGRLTCTAVGAVTPAPGGVHRAFIL